MRTPPILLGTLMAVPMVFVSGSAAALQPLDQFVAGARQHNPANAEVSASYEAQRAQADVALGRVLPSLAARGLYTRNEFQIGIPPNPLFGLKSTTYIQRFNQLDGLLTVTVPLLDLSSFERVAAAHTGADSAEQAMKATSLTVESLVIQTYFQLVADQALVTASQSALDVAKANLQLTQERFDAGKAPALEVDRATAEVERQSQQLTQAQLGVALAAQALESASGIRPDLTGQVSLADDLADEPELSTFLAHESQVPQVQAAHAASVAAEQAAAAQKLALVPTLAASGTEHFTNAAGFTGQTETYQAFGTLTWYLDYSVIAAMRQQDAAAAAARAREDVAALAVHDEIHRAWATVGAAIARSRSARAQQRASSHASKMAQDRYEAGVATQLDLLQAQRDAFSADVARIQADADLKNARLQLMLASGTDPFASRNLP